MSSCFWLALVSGIATDSFNKCMLHLISPDKRLIILSNCHATVAIYQDVVSRIAVLRSRDTENFALMWYAI